jgi:hypothetical protein
MKVEDRLYNNVLTRKNSENKNNKGKPNIPKSNKNEGNHSNLINSNNKNLDNNNNNKSPISSSRKLSEKLSSNRSHKRNQTDFSTSTITVIEKNKTKDNKNNINTDRENNFTPQKFIMEDRQNEPMQKIIEIRRNLHSYLNNANNLKIRGTITEDLSSGQPQNKLEIEQNENFYVENSHPTHNNYNQIIACTINQKIKDMRLNRNAKRFLLDKVNNKV